MLTMWIERIYAGENVLTEEKTPVESVVESAVEKPIIRRDYWEKRAG